MRFREVVFSFLRKTSTCFPLKESDRLKASNVLFVPAKFYNYLYWLLKPNDLVLVEAQGSKIYVDTRDVGIAPYLIKWGIYEKNVTHLLKKKLTEAWLLWTWEQMWDIIVCLHPDLLAKMEKCSPLNRTLIITLYS
jgi:hypothetical protein